MLVCPLQWTLTAFLAPHCTEGLEVHCTDHCQYSKMPYPYRVQELEFRTPVKIHAIFRYGSSNDDR